MTVKNWIFLFCVGLYMNLPYTDSKSPKVGVLLKNIANNQTLNDNVKNHFLLWKRMVSDNSKMNNQRSFPCSPLSPSNQVESVHKLRPSDIKVIGAIGDSITAGTGIDAVTAIGLLIEYRGQSWSGGGLDTFNEHLTLPNILKHYSSDLEGYATGRGDYESPNAHLNVADPGAKSVEMERQAELLVERMKTEEGVDFDNDWKIITVFIGGNDLCDYCEDKEKFSSEAYTNNVKKALDVFHAQVPRAFINVVPVLNIGIVNQLNQNLLCDTLHLFLCRCAAYPKDSQAESEMAQAVLDYQKGLSNLIDSGIYDNRNDFTVVIQPFFTETKLPLKPDTGEVDLSFFAPDCFHLSKSGHEAAATALWNNMLEPVGQKRVEWVPGEKISCPEESNPYFYTNKNSQEKSVYKRNRLQSRGMPKDSNYLSTREDKSKYSATEGDNLVQSANVSKSTIVGAVVLSVVIAVAIMALSLKIHRKRKSDSSMKASVSYASYNSI